MGGGALLGGEQGIPIAMNTISSGVFPHSQNNFLSSLFIDYIVENHSKIRQMQS